MSKAFPVPLVTGAFGAKGQGRNLLAGYLFPGVWARTLGPYLTEHINQFGEYSTHELGIQPDAYDPKLDVGFTPLRGDEPATEGFSGSSD
ncbi:hypothetical protein [Streptomyces sp. NPDC050548]|uniref:hypothetical protein n=1 Tax=Streptomyces sp. NPDC050548 TaxID=3365629 RepID=UPI0037AB01D9